uniref:Uncharacterized protein n=1 Tax=Anguilla anguilla TaxID=7936 RepID=A0A0E9UG35_ANGAN
MDPVRLLQPRKSRQMSLNVTPRYPLKFKYQLYQLIKRTVASAIKLEKILAKYVIAENYLRCFPVERACAFPMAVKNTTLLAELSGSWPPHLQKNHFDPRQPTK